MSLRFFVTPVALVLSLTSAPLVARQSATVGDARSSGGPLIVAHRGGTGDDPENTALAVRHAIENGADAMWLTIQMSRDGVPVLFRPKDLSTLSDRSGPVSSLTAAELAEVNVGYTFKGAAEPYPYRASPVTMPSLASVLPLLPTAMPLFLDIKSPDADPARMAAALHAVLDSAGAL